MSNLPVKAKALKPSMWTYMSVMNPSEIDNFLISKGYHQPEDDAVRAQALRHYYLNTPESDKVTARKEIIDLHPDKNTILATIAPPSVPKLETLLNCGGGCPYKNGDGGNSGKVVSKEDQKAKMTETAIIAASFLVVGIAIAVMLRPRK